MPETQRQRLAGRSPRVSGAGGGGGCLVVFGLPFVGVGVVLVLISAGAIPLASNARAPLWVLAAVGACFASAGLAVIGIGASAALRRRRLERARQERPGEPWMADYRWTADGVWDDPPSLLQQLGITLFMALFLAPFNFFVFFSGGAGVGFPMVIVGIFDLVLLLLLASLVYSALQRLKYGRSYLVFDMFPFYVGRTLSVRLRAPGRLARAERVKVVLRAVEVVTETRQTSKGTRTETCCDQVWAETRELDQAGLLPGGDIPLVFDLPDDVPGTRVDAPPVRYWELEVTAETPGIDFATGFVVPVYSRA